MAYSENKFGGAIWTNHALERMAQRRMPKDIAVSVFNFPDSSKQGRTPGSMEYVKQVGKHTVSIVAKKNDRGEWLVLSCWANPAFPGSIDDTQHYGKGQVKYKSKSFWGRVAEGLLSIFKV